MSNLYSEIASDSKYDVLSAKENDELVIKAKNDPSFIDEAMNHNLRLVLKIANRFNHTPMSFDDRFQEGCRGLEHAIVSFDPTMCNSFATYAHKCVYGYITNGLHEQGSNIVIPSALRQRINKVNKFRNEYMAKNGCEPYDYEICDALELSALQIERVRHAMAGTIVSMNQEVGEDSEIECFISGEDTVEDDVSESMTLDGYSSNPEDIYWKKERAEKIAEAINGLPEVERVIIQKRLEGMKLDQIATYLKNAHNINRTLQCVQQMETRGHNKIKEKFESPYEKRSRK